MGRKGAGAAAGDAVSMAAAGEASDDEEEPTEERYTDPWAEEDEPHDPAADASGAGAARWLLHVARPPGDSYGLLTLRNSTARRYSHLKTARCSTHNFNFSQHSASTVRGVFAHAPVQQPAWLWPSEALVRRSGCSTAVPPHGGEKTGRKRRNLTCTVFAECSEHE